MEERAALATVVELGRTAIPLCLRGLRSENEAVAAWAYSLLLHLAQSSPEVHPRVVETANDLAEADTTPDNRKVLALALLTELEADLPPVELSDLGATRERSLHDLAACLDSPAEVARAAHLLLSRLRESEVVELVDELAEAEPGQAEALIDELLVRDDVSERCIAELRQIRAPLIEDPTQAAPHAVDRPAPRARTSFWLGRTANGSTVLVAARRRPGSRPVRRRALCCSIAAAGTVVDAMYRDDFTERGVEREVVRPLEERGYSFEHVDPEVARGLLERATRTTRTKTGRLPEAYYLGRDLFGIFHGHLPTRARERVACRLAPMLARALDLMSAGLHGRARPLLERYVAEVSDDADGWENLGLCDLLAGRPKDALRHLRRAVLIAPTTPIHHWNLAVAAHRAGRLGGSYLALLSFLDLSEDGPEESDRRAHAHELVVEYERLARTEYPDASPSELARAEELCARAEELSGAGEPGRSVELLERAHALVSDHYPSLMGLGRAHAAHSRLREAEQCLEDALRARPSSADALRALAQVRAQRARQARAQNGRAAKGEQKAKRARPRRSARTPQSGSLSR